jgi:serine/threonine protein kinase
MSELAPNVAVADSQALESLMVRVADEFIDRLNRGEQPDIEDYAARHPQIAGLLRQMLPALQLLRVPATAVGGTEGVAGAPVLEAECLGDFRLLREVGRGGMGVVYEAEQRSLGRRVAVKVLPFAAALDPRHLQRFRNEAHAAAQLHHTHIVPVYFVGCERGVHFYAMQFIDGRTLAALIAERRPAAGRDTTDSDPGPRPAGAKPAAAPDTAPRAAGGTEQSARDPEHFRTVARLGVQAAEALEYAHRLGVVHRDVKPANLLVDGGGGLWVTDFGLAQLQSETKLTLTGDLLGTLRYMSPELTLGGRAPLDHRTDVYSLGATLYEALTLEPTFDGQDRQELLRQIALAEPRRPRRINRAIPDELEVIVLKTLAKNPAERYASAQELADDLRRFLEDKPVRARRPTLPQRLRRWTWRHRSVVLTTAVAAGVLLVMAVILLAVSHVRLREEQIRTKQEWKRAEDAFQAEAQQRHRAERTVGHALDALDAIYLRIVENQFPRDPRREKEDRELLDKALAFYEKFAQENEQQREVWDEAARAYRRVGIIHVALGRYAEAVGNFERAIDLYEQLAQEDPAQSSHREGLHQTQMRLAVALQKHGAWRRAAEHYRRAVAVQEQLVKDFPGVPTHVGWLADGRAALGVMLLEEGEQAAAAACFQQALDLVGPLVKQYPDAEGYRHTLALSHHNLAQLLMESRERSAAAGHFRDAVALQGALRAARPQLRDYKHELAMTLTDYGGYLDTEGESVAAGEQLHHALELWRELVRDFPMMPDCRWGLAGTHVNLGVFHRRKGEPASAAEHYRQGINLLTKLTEEFPKVAFYHQALGRGQRGLGLVLEADKQPDAAREQYRQALVVWKRLADQFPRVPEYRAGLALTESSLAVCLRRSGDEDGAVKHHREALRLETELVAQHPERPMYQQNLSATLASLGWRLALRGELPQGREMLEQAVRHQRAALDIWPASPEYRQDLLTCYHTLTRILLRMADHVEAARVVNEWSRLPFPHDATLPKRAAHLAECVKLAEQDQALSPERRAELARGYGDQSMVLLRQAADGGQESAASLAAPSAYPSLRARTDFQKLLAEVRAPGRKTDTRQPDAGGKPLGAKTPSPPDP